MAERWLMLLVYTLPDCSLLVSATMLAVPARASGGLVGITEHSRSENQIPNFSLEAFPQNSTIAHHDFGLDVDRLVYPGVVLSSLGSSDVDLRLIHIPFFL